MRSVRFVSKYLFEVFANNSNLTFLYKIDIEEFSKERKINLPAVGIELTTDHHWFRRLMLTDAPFKTPRCKFYTTRMHSSRINTACSSSHGGGGLPQCMLGYTPLGVGLETAPVWAWRPPGCGSGKPPGQTPQLPPWVWAWRPPWPDPSTSPLGVGLETPLARPLNSPWVWAWKPARHAGMPPAMHAGILPPCEQNDWQTFVKT